MALTSFRLPTNQSQTNAPKGGTVDWINPSNVQLDDGSVALHDINNANFSPRVSKYLFAHNFGFTTLGLPANDVVRGVEMRFEARHVVTQGGVAASVNALRIFLGGVPVGPDYSLSGVPNFTSSFAIYTYGSITADVNWGVLKPRVSDLTEAGFGFGLSIRLTGDAKSPALPDSDFEVDFVEMRIRHEPPREPRRTGIIHT